jgi:SSS family solute:Na+ symporter
MLLSYAFMVSGLFVPIIGALYWKKSSSTGAIAAMLGGGFVTLLLTWLSGDTITLFGASFGNIQMPYGLDPNLYGITISFILFVSLSYWFPSQEAGA